MSKIFKCMALLKRRGEQGWSLTSTLVAVVLTVIVGVVVVAIMVSAQKTSSQFTDTVMTESELNNAVSTISKQLTTADAILHADKEVLKVSNTVKGVKRESVYFSWMPGETSLASIQKADSSMKSTELPDFPAIASKTIVYKDDGTTVDSSEVKVLVNGYVPADKLPLFTYFDADDKELSAPVPNDSLSLIKRVQVVIKASVEGRDAPMEVATSVTPRGGNSGTQGEEWTDQDETLGAPVLKGSIVPREKVTHLTWNFVDKADSYTLYAKPQHASVGTPSYSVVGTTVNNKMDHPDLYNGQTYDYYVVANNIQGSSPMSNIVSLTVNPAAPKLSGNVNDTFTNTLKWDTKYGAHGYRLIRDGVTIYTSSVSSGPDRGMMATQIRYEDKTAKAGEEHTYKVVAFNTLGTGKDSALGNGDSFWSNEVTLFANPEAPILTGSVSKGDRILKWNTVNGAQGYQLQRISPSAKTFSDQTTTTLTDKDKIVSKSFKYQVRAKTPAGYGKWSNIVTLYPNPDPVQPVVYDYTNSSSSYNGQNKITWPSSGEATYYDFAQGSGWNNVGNTLSRIEKAGADSKTTYKVRACNYTGCSDYNYDIGLQPPGPFSISSYSESARRGYTSTRPDAQMSLSKQIAKFSWGASSGADSYTYSGAKDSGTTTDRSFKSDSYTPGTTYSISVSAKGKTSGLTRKAGTYKWQAAPAQPKNVHFRMQYKGASDGATRISLWGANSSYVPSTGSATRLEMRSGLRYRTSSNSDYSFNGDSSWNTWKATRYTASFNKSYTSTRETGGIGWARSYKTIASGYRGTTTSQDSHSSRDWTVTGNSNRSFDGGFLGIYGGTSVANPNHWTTSSGSVAPSKSDWTNVPYSSRNYPVNAQTGNKVNWYGISAR